jgi:putative peptide zinc metalloprotease protein
MTARLRRSIALRLLVTTLASLIAIVTPATTARADDDINEVKAVNTEDGASVFRFALSISKVTDGVVDQKNTATAHASCVDCATVAVAFQVIFVSGDANVVVPENRAEAANVDCQECLTYAAATQIVVGIDGKELTDNGKRRLKDLEKRMRDVERNADNMTDAELLKAAQDAEAELIAILNEELVPIGGGSGSGTTTTTTSSSTTSTSTPSGTSTTTTTTTVATTTTTTAAAA